MSITTEPPGEIAVTLTVLCCSPEGWAAACSLLAARFSIKADWLAPPTTASARGVAHIAEAELASWLDSTTTGAGGSSRWTELRDVSAIVGESVGAWGWLIGDLWRRMVDRRLTKEVLCLKLIWGRLF